MCKNLTVLAFAFFFTADVALSADDRPWGLVADGLQMSVAFSRTSGNNSPELEITIRNVGDQDVLTCVGPINGRQFYAEKFKIILRIANEPKTVILIGSPGVAGVVAALAIPLVRRASYTLRIPANQYFVLEDSQTLTEEFLQGKPVTLSVNLDGVSTAKFCQRLAGQAELPYWSSLLISNTLER